MGTHYSYYRNVAKDVLPKFNNEGTLDKSKLRESL
jgi:hypothetical protein